MYSVIPKIHQGIYILHGNQINTSTVAAIAAVRASHRNIFFTPKANSTITTIARFYTNFRFVNKSHKLYTATLKNQPIKTKKAPP
jgi:hypothetical protein